MQNVRLLHRCHARLCSSSGKAEQYDSTSICSHFLDYMVALPQSGCSIGQVAQICKRNDKHTAMVAGGPVEILLDWHPGRLVWHVFECLRNIGCPHGGS